MRRLLLVLLLFAVAAVTACSGQPATPDVVEKQVTTVVEKEVTSVVEKEVTTVVEKEVEKEVVVTATPGPRTEMVIGFVELQTNIDPQFSVAPPAMVLYNAFADPLVRINPDNGEVVPALATSWEFVDDTTLEVKLREGVTFQNGEPFNADAVKFSFDRAVDPDLALTVASRLRTLEDVAVVDDSTVRITTTDPDALLVRRLALVNMVPPAYLQEVGDDAFALSPIGTGAFRLVRNIPQQEVVFEAWPESWRGAPNLDRLVFKPIPDASARVSALIAGDVDMIYGIAPDEATRIEDAGMQVMSTAKGHVYEIQMKWVNCDCPLEDPRVRQALNYAIDKEALVDGLFGGLVEIAPGQHFFEFTNGYNPDVEAYPYDPERARELLAEAGYADGFTMNFETTDGRAPLDKAVAETVAAYLADVGVTAELEIIDTEQYLARFHDPTLRSPLRQGFWAHVPILDADLVLTWFQCSQEREFHCDPEFDEVYQASLTEVDPDARLELLHQAVQLIHDNPPDIFLFSHPEIYGVSSQIAGFKPRPDGLMWFDDLALTQ